MLLRDKVITPLDCIRNGKNGFKCAGKMAVLSAWKAMHSDRACFQLECAVCHVRDFQTYDYPSEEAPPVLIKRNDDPETPPAQQSCEFCFARDVKLVYNEGCWVCEDCDQYMDLGSKVMDPKVDPALLVEEFKLKWARENRETE